LRNVIRLRVCGVYGIRFETEESLDSTKMGNMHIDLHMSSN